MTSTADQTIIQLKRNLTLIRLIQSLIISSENLPYNIKECLESLLTCQALNSCGTISSCFNFKVPNNQIPKNFKCVIQKALINKLDEVKSDINAVMSLSDEYCYWTETNKLVKANEVMNLKIEDERQKMVSLLDIYSQDVDGYLKKMNDYMEKQFLDTENVCYDVYAKWLKTKSDALMIRAKVTETKLLEKFYTADRIQRLADIDQKASSELNSLRAKFKGAKMRLKCYSDASGPEFDVIVSNYRKLDKQINDKRWALKEFTGTGNGGSLELSDIARTAATTSDFSLNSLL